jgi:hypothetical protein
VTDVRNAVLNSFSSRSTCQRRPSFLSFGGRESQDRTTFANIRAVSHRFTSQCLWTFYAHDIGSRRYSQKTVSLGDGRNAKNMVVVADVVDTVLICLSRHDLSHRTFAVCS